MSRTQGHARRRAGVRTLRAHRPRSTGHIGSAVAAGLLERGEPVTVVSRDAGRADALRARGAEVAVADVRDVSVLREVLACGTRLFLLDPATRPPTSARA